MCLVDIGDTKTLANNKILEIVYHVWKCVLLRLFTFESASLSGGNVIIVIGGDDNYRGEIEEESVVISSWAKRKVISQIGEEYLDGRKSFTFSWNRQHRAIHEEALLHHFDPNKKGQKFKYQRTPQVKKPEMLPVEPRLSCRSPEPELLKRDMAVLEEREGAVLEGREGAKVVLRGQPKSSQKRELRFVRVMKPPKKWF